MSRPLRVAVLTCGTIVTNGHLPAFAALGRDTVDVVAFTSRTRASAQRAAAQWGSGDVVDSWREVLTRDDVDAILVRNPARLLTFAAPGSLSRPRRSPGTEPIVIHPNFDDPLPETMENLI